MKILSFDIEDWFHILDNDSTKSVDSWSRFESRIDEGVSRIIDLLQETDQKATFFCLGWVAKEHPSVIQKIVNSGYQVASHSMNHQLVYEQTPEVFRKDLSESVKVLEDVSGKQVSMYRAPGFSITDECLWAFDIMEEEGIEIDCSIFPASRAHGGMKSYGVAEPSIIQRNGYSLKSFPINTKSLLGRDLIYSGGGYFRLLPKYLISKFFSDDDYVMTYFHPRDFDSEQPLVPGLGLTRRFKSYVGIKGALSKLKYLLQNNTFMDLEEAANIIDWKYAKVVDLND
ncbi:polysaccharide deacetylase family protein [Kangiella sediminilitoris]|uniref:Polysaccharide deacetylase n=1 Tax=Kangiella sediminilitoris TaxID=1144748 RepID=A0A1B3BBJ1_9GAMM|nr:polysaccharide deacetylase family protein [Kangiella sediminilitoris]AOE50156.1 Polysaccharide deacetylase [Kangiella sediminilitoris]